MTENPYTSPAVIHRRNRFRTPLFATAWVAFGGILLLGLGMIVVFLTREPATVTSLPEFAEAIVQGMIFLGLGIWLALGGLAMTLVTTLVWWVTR